MLGLALTERLRVPLGLAQAEVLPLPLPPPAPPLALPLRVPDNVPLLLT